MASTWDTLRRGLQERAAAAFTKAEGLTQVGRARLDIAAAKTRLSRLHGDLGVEVFRRLEAGQGAAVADDPQVRDLCARIREATAALNASESEFEQLQRDLATQDEDGPEAAPPGT